MNASATLRERWEAGDREDIHVVDDIGRAYQRLLHARWIDLLGQWVSGLPPVRFEQIDVSPEILVRIGISHSTDVAPTISAEMHVTELMR